MLMTIDNDFFPYHFLMLHYENVFENKPYCSVIILLNDKQGLLLVDYPLLKLHNDWCH